MDCNKDEATRAKEIAERKFSAKDIVGARKFALKAQALFPGLEGIPQMLSTLDVYISAENKINGEADWYGILGVDPKAEDDTVRKQYRKLALMLHPDKNKSIGSDGAFKLISEAWTLLSDKAKRTAYDQKRNVTTQQKVKASTNQSGGSSVQTPGTNGFYPSKVPKYSATKPPKVPKHSSTTAPAPAPAPTHHKPKPNTFWTVCHGCKMQYEYLRVYLNHNLLCPNCHEPFLARETAPPPSNGVGVGGSKSPASWNYSQKRANSGKQSASKKAFSGSRSQSQSSFQWAPFSKTGGASSAAQAATMVQQAYERVKREREESEAAARREEASRMRNHSSKRTTVAGASCSPSTGQSQPNAAKRRKGVDADMDATDSGWDFVYEIGVKIGGGGPEKGSVTMDSSRTDIRVFLMEKARREIRKKLDDWRSVEADETRGARENVEDFGECPEKLTTGSPWTSSGTETLETMSINVPDPDFHDFDKDRTERSFGDNQIWAAYDSDDGMPRYYAMIHGVVSADPFKVRIGWLNSRTSPLSWVGSGFAKTCGDFRVGRFEISTSLNSFSHKVRWSRGSRGTIRICPRKGEVWALYRNWSPDWNELTEEGVIREYEMVEILGGGDYDDEETGVAVAPLVKVAGFKAVFHRHLDLGTVKTIPRDEMLRFSHHVPSRVLTGQEAPNAPKGCRELDPAAVPTELLRVISDAQEIEDLDKVTEEVTEVINVEESTKRKE